MKASNNTVRTTVASFLVAGTLVFAQSALANGQSYNIGNSNYYNGGKTHCAPVKQPPTKPCPPPTYCPPPNCPPCVPEPSTNALIGLTSVIGGVLLLRRRKSTLAA